MLRGKANAAIADEVQVIANERRYPFGIDGAAEVGEEIVGHIEPMYVKKAPPVVPAGLLCLCKLMARALRKGELHDRHLVRLA